MQTILFFLTKIFSSKADRIKPCVETFANFVSPTARQQTQNYTTPRSNSSAR